MHGILTVTGVNNTGPWYNFWSGFAGDLTIFGAIFALYYKHNCHVKGCPRIGKHSVNGTPYCTRHLK